MRENKRLSDRELAAKYEAGAIDLSKAIKESIVKHGFDKKNSDKKTQKISYLSFGFFISFKSGLDLSFLRIFLGFFSQSENSSCDIPADVRFVCM